MSDAEKIKGFKLPDAVIGSLRSFGEDGIVYQVVEVEEDTPEMATILLVESGETTHYPVQQLLADPVLH